MNFDAAFYKFILRKTSEYTDTAVGAIIGVTFKDAVTTAANLPLIGNIKNDARITNDDQHIYLWDGTQWIDQGNFIDVTWNAILNKPVSSVVDIDDAVAKKHAHINSTALNAVSGVNTGDQDLSPYAKLDSTNQPFTGNIRSIDGTINIGIDQIQHSINVRKLNQASLNLDYLPDTNGNGDANTRRLYEYEGTVPSEQIPCGNNYSDSLVYNSCILSTEQFKFGSKSLKIQTGGSIASNSYCPLPTSLQFANYGSGHIMFWLYIPEGTPAFTLTLYQGAVDGYWDNTNGYIWLNWSPTGNSNLRLYRTFVGSVVQDQTINDGIITAGQWHHFAFNTNSGFSYYRDGNRIGTASTFSCYWGNSGGRDQLSPSWFVTPQQIFVDDFLWYATNLYTGTTYIVPTKPNGPAVGTPTVQFQSIDVTKAQILTDGVDGDKLKFKCPTTTRMTIVPSTGNVGIGIDTPTEKLNVSGNILASGTITGSNLSGTNTGNETVTSVGTLINAATAKTTPIDSDMIGLMDSAASNILKKLSWANIKATLKTYFDTLYTLANLGGVPTSRQINGKALSSDVTLTTADIADSIDKRYVTDAEKTKLSNTSGINTGDQDLSALALKSNVLELNNTTAFTPDADYEPATKKYVDDNIGGNAQLTKIQFVNADLVAGKLTVTHNLNLESNKEILLVTIIDNNKKVILPDDITFSANSFEVDMTSYGTLTGTYQLAYIA